MVYGEFLLLFSHMTHQVDAYDMLFNIYTCYLCSDAPNCPVNIFKNPKYFIKHGVRWFKYKLEPPETVNT